MKLHGRKNLSDAQYYANAAKIKAEIIRISNSQARHPAVRDLQNVFRKNTHRLYHWAHDRRVPPDNNYSERGLRPLVISRKLSFGTQSEKGSHTRGILMSVLHSLKKQGHDPGLRICEALDLKSRNPQFDIAGFLFPNNKFYAPLRTDPEEGRHAGIRRSSEASKDEDFADTA